MIRPPLAVAMSLLAHAPLLATETAHADTADRSDSTPAVDRTAPEANRLEPGVRAMLEAAAHSGNKGRLDAVVAVARQTNPKARAEIDEIVGAIVSAQNAEREQRLREARFHQNWKGSGQLGGSIATGNSDSQALAAGITLAREGIEWRHATGAIADVQRSSGRTTQERYGAHWQSDWKFSERGWLFGRISWERNLVAGLRSRFTETLGAGYRLVDNPTFRLDVEGGPAMTQSDFIDRTENLFAMRGASNFEWRLNPNLQLSEKAAIIYQTNNSTFNSTTALTSRIFSKLQARLSYTIAHETNPPPERENTDTITRATLVYDF